MKLMSLIFAALLGFAASEITSSGSYFPEPLYGVPVDVSVVELQGPDFRGTPVYLINLSVEENNTAIIKDSLVHRNYEEFSLLVDRVNEEDMARDSITLPG